MNLQQYRDLFLSFCLQIFYFGLVTALVFASAQAETNIKITSSFIISVILFMPLHFRYVYIKQKFEKDMLLKIEAMDDFCHAIGTPVSTICGIAEIFGDAQTGFNSEQKELLRRLNSGTARLRSLIAESPDFSDFKGKSPDRGVYACA